MDMDKGCRVVSHELDLNMATIMEHSYSSAVLDIVARVNAEMERLGRMLPDAPTGSHWEFEQQRMGEQDFLSNSVRFRVVATLKEDM
jgi:hypothetical protein